MILWGRESGSSTYLSSGGRYSPATDSWSPTTLIGAPSGRVIHTAVWTGTETIIWSGFSGTYLDTGARYRPASDTWTPMPVSRS
jgi:hypothetical protein